MLTHQISAWITIHSPDLTKMLFDQISTCSVVLGIPYRPCITGLFVIMGVLDFLLEPKLLKDLEVDQAGVKLFPTALLVLEGKARTHDNLLGSKGNIDARIMGFILHTGRFAD